MKATFLNIISVEKLHFDKNVGQSLSRRCPLATQQLSCSPKVSFSVS